MPSKTRRIFTMTNEAHRLLKIIAANYGVPMSNMLEVIIRQEADRQGIERKIETEDLPENDTEE